VLGLAGLQRCPRHPGHRGLRLRPESINRNVTPSYPRHDLTVGRPDVRSVSLDATTVNGGAGCHDGQENPGMEGGPWPTKVPHCR